MFVKFFAIVAMFVGASAGQDDLSLAVNETENLQDTKEFKVLSYVYSLLGSCPEVIQCLYEKEAEFGEENVTDAAKDLLEKIKSGEIYKLEYELDTICKLREVATTCYNRCPADKDSLFDAFNTIYGYLCENKDAVKKSAQCAEEEKINVTAANEECTEQCLSSSSATKQHMKQFVRRFTTIRPPAIHEIILEVTGNNGTVDQLCGVTNCYINCVVEKATNEEEECGTAIKTSFELIEIIMRETVGFMERINLACFIPDQCKAFAELKKDNTESEELIEKSDSFKIEAEVTGLHVSKL